MKKTCLAFVPTSVRHLRNGSTREPETAVVVEAHAENTPVPLATTQQLGVAAQLAPADTPEKDIAVLIDGNTFRNEMTVVELQGYARAPDRCIKRCDSLPVGRPSRKFLQGGKFVHLIGAKIDAFGEQQLQGLQRACRVIIERLREREIKQSTRVTGASRERLAGRNDHGVVVLRLVGRNKFRTCVPIVVRADKRRGKKRHAGEPEVPDPSGTYHRPSMIQDVGTNRRCVAGPWAQE